MDIGIKFECKIKQHYKLLLFSKNKARFIQKQ